MQAAQTARVGVRAGHGGPVQCREEVMDRDDLLVFCAEFARGRRVVAGSVRAGHGPGDPVPEIMRGFRRAEISESEKNALLSLVCDPEDEAECCAETACVHDPWADEQMAAGDDDG
jgi:hypothetical protein